MGNQSRRKKDEMLKRRLDAKWPEISRKSGEQADAEIGRQLRIEELVPQKIVLINVEGHPNMFMTAWVESINTETVQFRMAELQMIITNFRTPDGLLTDDKGKTINVYEWKPAEKHRKN